MPKSFRECKPGHQALEIVARLVGGHGGGDATADDAAPDDAAPGDDAPDDDAPEPVFPGLHEARVRVGVTMARSTRGPAVTHHGDPALATVKIISTQLRSEGQPDARITVDASAWDDMGEDARVALIDHELTHLVPARSKKDFALRLDEAGRPVLKMRRHDIVIGGFREVVERRGAAAPEYRDAQYIYRKYGQLLWPWGANVPHGGADVPNGDEDAAGDVRLARMRADLTEAVADAALADAIDRRADVAGDDTADDAGDVLARAALEAGEPDDAADDGEPDGEAEGDAAVDRVVDYVTAAVESGEVARRARSRKAKGGPKGGANSKGGTASKGGAKSRAGKPAGKPKGKAPGTAARSAARSAASAGA